MRTVVTVVTIVLVTMLSACGLNQPGTNDSDNSLNANTTELPVVQQPAEAAVEQMQSSDSQMSSMEEKGDMKPAEAMAEQPADNAESGAVTMQADGDASQDPASTTEGEQSEVTKKPEQKTEIKS